MSKSLTIFTPTYNRAYILPKLYESLCRQSSKDFVWLIVDDGSTDNTEELIEEWINDGKIDIIYHKQPNGGKMRAHNVGAKLCDTQLFACVDSDDYMVDDAIEKILDFWKTNYSGEDYICGMIANRAMVSPERPEPYVIKDFPADIKSCRMRDLSIKYGHRGETTIVFRSDVIKSYPFPEIEGEKFITEVVVYDQIDKHFNILLYKEPLVICEFFDDGYTKNPIGLYKNNPKGWAYLYNQRCKLWHDEYSFKEKIKQLTYYIVMSKLAGEKNIYRNSNDKSIRYVFAYLISSYFKRKFVKLFNEND